MCHLARFTLLCRVIEDPEGCGSAAEKTETGREDDRVEKVSFRQI